MPPSDPTLTPGDPQAELAHRVRALELRVTHLEQERARAPGVEQRVAVSEVTPPPPLPAFFPAAPAAPPPLPSPTTPPPQRRLDFELNPLEQKAEALSRLARDRAAQKVFGPGAASRQATSGEQPKPLDFEQLVGGRWFAAIGALAVTIGVGLFVKLAYDHGWLRVPPVWRCVGGAGFGVLLIVCAEWLRGKFGKWAAFGSYSAGLGAIYVSTFLAHRLYDLMPAGAAFATMGVVAVFGLLISVRARLQAVGVMSLLAGYLAPFLLADAPDKPLVLPAYLLALQAIGLGLVAFRAGSFGVVRQVVTWGTVLLGGFWLFRTGMNIGWWAQAFMVVAWGLTHAELTWTAIGASTGEDEDGGRVSVLRSGGAAMVASLGVTGWWVSIGSSLADRTGLMPIWLVPLGACGATALLGMFVSGSGLLLDRAARTAREALGQCLVALSAALLAITVTLALDGPGEVVAWLALGSAATVMAWRMRAKAVRVYGCVLLAIGTGRLLAYDSWAGMHAGGLDVVGLHLTTWTVMVTLAAMAWMGTLLTSRRDPASRNPLTAIILTIGACLLLLIAVMHRDTPMATITWVWLGIIVLLAVVRGTEKLPLDRAAGALFVLPCVVWGVGVLNWGMEFGGAAGHHGVGECDSFVGRQSVETRAAIQHSVVQKVVRFWLQDSGRGGD